MKRLGIAGIVLLTLGFVVLREWGFSAPTAVLLESGLVMAGLLMWSVFYSDEVQIPSAEHTFLLRLGWTVAGGSWGMLLGDVIGVLPVHLSPVSRILAFAMGVVFGGLAISLQWKNQPLRKFAILLVMETLAVIVFVSMPGDAPWNSLGCVGSEIRHIVRAESPNACTTVCTWWVPKPCSGYNDAGNYVSCNASGIDQNGQPCLGCCFAQTVVCDTPTPEPTALPTRTSTATATSLPSTPTRTATPGLSLTPTPTRTHVPASTLSTIAVPTDTPTPTPTDTPIPTPTDTPIPTLTDTPTPTPTDTPIPTPTDTPIPTPTETPTQLPTGIATGTPVPTWTPTPVATVTGTPVPITTVIPTPTSQPVTGSVCVLPTPTPQENRENGQGIGQNGCSLFSGGGNENAGSGVSGIALYPSPAVVQGGDGYPLAHLGEYYILPGGFQPQAQCPVGYTPLYVRVFVDYNGDEYMSPYEGVSNLQVFVLSNTYDRLGYTWTLDGQGLFCLTPTQYNTRVYLDLPYLQKFGAVDVPEAPQGFLEVWFRMDAPVLPLFLP